MEGGVFENDLMNCATKDRKPVLFCSSVSGRSVVNMSTHHLSHVALIVCCYESMSAQEPLWASDTVVIGTRYRNRGEYSVSWIGSSFVADLGKNGALLASFQDLSDGLAIWH